MRHVLENHLARVTWDEARFPVRLHPFLAADTHAGAMPIVIDPRLAFGRPVLLSQRISTAAIVDRIDAGERPADVALDYGLTEADIDQAVLYERAA
ncbi:MAG TPA: DUF433 domain-containing protein [Vicinamibacterales bacterium]|nr:DUF433 domain-containing protein [Vicinamibacterales bacterium]